MKFVLQGFFRRTLKKQLVYKPCQMGNQCKIDAGTRNKCQYCRYQRCLNAGMSQDGRSLTCLLQSRVSRVVSYKRVVTQYVTVTELQ